MRAFGPKVRVNTIRCGMFRTDISKAWGDPTAVDETLRALRSRHPNALPLIITHGWPGSVLELVKTIGQLTDPTANGGSAEEAFDFGYRCATLWIDAWAHRRD